MSINIHYKSMRTASSDSTSSCDIEQIYTGCLAQGAYFITSAGESCVIDPLRETRPYMKRIESSGTTLKYIFETHFHADFVSGHTDLAKATGAPIVFGPLANCNFDCIVAQDQQLFKVGDITITAIHTPGHTMESTCYLLRDERGIAKALFSGDTLFIGDVGRPDLAQKGTGLTTEDLARHLYNSLRTKVMPLPDDITIYPAHGAGSACGKNMSSQTYDSLMNQKKTNYALKADMTVEEFIKELTTDLPAPPQYFPIAVQKNKADLTSESGSFDDLVKKGMKKLSVDEVEKYANIKEEDGDRPLIIDTRWHDSFTAGHIPGAVYAGIEGPFGPFIAAAIGEVNKPYIIVGWPEKYEEIFTRLSRFGFDHPVGHLDGGMDAWKAAGKPLATIDNITADELADAIASDNQIQLIDVRKPGEHRVKHLPQAKNLPLDSSNVDKVDSSKPLFVHCGSGYRSVIYGSLVKRNNPEIEMKNVVGGMMKMAESKKLEAAGLYISPCQRK